MNRLAMDDVAVRGLQDSDAVYLLRWLNDPRVLEFYEGRDRPFTLEMIQEHFYEDPGCRRCLVEYQGRPAGYVQYYLLEEDGFSEYGLPPEKGSVYGMDQFIGEPELWGKGIGRAFIGLMLRYLTGKLGRRLWYWTLIRTTFGQCAVTRRAGSGSGSCFRGMSFTRGKSATAG